MQFWKVHGTRNDFVLVDETEEEVVPESDKPDFARWACNRRSGIGADGVVFIRSDPPSVEMRVFNRDGSEAEFCGNAARCVVKYVTEVRGENVKVLRTLSGVHRVVVLGGWIAVEVPEAEIKKVVELGYEVDAGVPHFVRLTERDPVRDFRSLTDDAKAIFSEYESIGGVNVTYAAPSVEELRVRTFERGVGWTPACGSGVVAASLVYSEIFGPFDEVSVRTAGGSLRVSLSDGPLLIGTAEIVYKGELRGDWRENTDHQRRRYSLSRSPSGCPRLQKCR
ncbi:diaminopimelate epimerase [Methanopyrus sp. SNP6]|uniref:diaminopimelate epimerase n=1 Tax=Methanopyrus sp. SNP6 TaxID=1937005 RepID=UPI0011E5C7E6|nr:diaminopimelate epimerase [Methanopyrus sp. SNP6]